jgi:hypothetical protein
MTPIHQALRTAIGIYAGDAHKHWIKAQRHAERSFSHAVAGWQLERVLAETQYHTRQSLYQQNDKKLSRTLEMMK